MNEPDHSYPDAQTIVRKRNGITHIGTAGINSGAPVQVHAMPIWQLLIVRVLRTYISTFLGLLTLDGSGVVDIQVAGQTWNVLFTTAVVAIAPSLVSLLHNAVEFLTELDIRNPGWRA